MLRFTQSDQREAAAVLIAGWRSPARGGRSYQTDAGGLEHLNLLASAIAGHPVEVAPVDAGQPSWTDGATVFVETMGSPTRQLACVAVQSSLLGAGSLATEILGALIRRPVLTRRYLAIEGHRALSVQERLLPRPVRGILDPTVASRAQSATESLAIAQSRQAIDDPLEVFGTIRPRQVRAHAERRGDRDALDQKLSRLSEERRLAELESDEEDDGITDPFSSPVGGGGGLGRLLKKLFGDGRSSANGSPGADSPTHWSRHGNRIARTVALSTAAVPISADFAAREPQRVTYPEWDLHQRRYKPNWCTVVEVEATFGIAPLVPVDTLALRRSLARLGMELERHHRQLQGDDIDIDAVVEARVELIAGSPPDEALYIDTLRRRRDLSVLILLDVSGSAGEPSATGVPVHEHQRTAAAALAAALYDLGDRVALYGFRSQGRSAVHVVPAKRFGDDLDALVMQRIGGFSPGGYTRVGAAIRHGAAVLEQDAGTSRRLLVVISDGFAYDHGYERAYGEADARRALAETRRRGIGSLCLSIGAATDAEALQRVFGTAAHATMSGLDQLPSVVGPLFRSALRSADLKRKASQRRGRTKERLNLERRTA